MMIYNLRGNTQCPYRGERTRSEAINKRQCLEHLSR